MTYETQRDLVVEGSVKSGAIRFRRSRVALAGDVAGHEEIAVSGLLAVVAAQRTSFGRD
jgi:hypothetical protein